MNKELLKIYEATLDLFGEDEEIISYYDKKYYTIGNGRFNSVYGANELKWGNRIVIPDEGRYRGLYTTIKGVKYYNVYSVIRVKNDIVEYGVNDNHVIGGMHFERCKQLIGYETRVKLKDL